MRCLPMMRAVVVLGISLMLGACAGLSGVGPDARELQALHDEARTALERGDRPTALYALQQARELAPEDVETLEMLLRLYRLSGDAQREASIALQLLLVDPDHVTALERLGLISLRQGRPLIAADYLRQATQLDPGRWESWSGLGVIADTNGEHELARTYYHRSLDELPGHPRVLANLGWSLILSGEPEQAEVQLRQSLSAAPDSSTTRSNLAHALALQGRYEEARAIYRDLYAPAVVANNLGQAALQRGDRAEARSFLRQAVDLHPRYYEHAARALERLEAGEMPDQPFELRVGQP